MENKTAKDGKGSAAKRSARILAVIDPKRREEFLANAKEILGNDLVYVSSIEGNGDFTERTRGLNLYFSRLNIVSLADGLTDRARQYFTAIELEQVRRSPASPSWRAFDASPEAAQCLQDDAKSSWGIKATQRGFGLTGEGVKVALLDSGMDFDHEAFRGRAAGFPRRSFVTPPAEFDEFGHGTGCASIICGLPETANGRRIGIAPAVDLVVAKIFDEEEESPDTRTLAAIEWALSMGCSIISMSIGEAVDPNNGPDAFFEAAAEAAMRVDKAVLIAGAGNDSLRSGGNIKAVNHPANCPSVVAVAAVDECLKVANFSNGELPPKGGEINLAAPGVMVRVARQRAQVDRYVFRDGTSFAVPFVSGTAALWLQALPGIAGAQLRQKLKDSAKPLPPQLSKDVGDGLVQGP
jgi:subtilisin